mmetsp:Transcript_24947/g.62523  ORF Transcript_24947/g.62523 Transcript_24947/m.62523 type:complete len:223 (+) Transcript_24947:1021-1689(+)
MVSSIAPLVIAASLNSPACCSAASPCSDTSLSAREGAFTSLLGCGVPLRAMRRDNGVVSEAAVSSDDGRFVGESRGAGGGCEEKRTAGRGAEEAAEGSVARAGFAGTGFCGFAPLACCLCTFLRTSAALASPGGPDQPFDGPVVFCAPRFASGGTEGSEEAAEVSEGSEMLPVVVFSRSAASLRSCVERCCVSNLCLCSLLMRPISSSYSPLNREVCEALIT